MIGAARRGGGTIWWKGRGRGAGRRDGGGGEVGWNSASWGLVLGYREAEGCPGCGMRVEGNGVHCWRDGMALGDSKPVQASRYGTVYITSREKIEHCLKSYKTNHIESQFHFHIHAFGKFPGKVHRKGPPLSHRPNSTTQVTDFLLTPSNVL